MIISVYTIFILTSDNKDPMILILRPLMSVFPIKYLATHSYKEVLNKQRCSKISYTVITLFVLNFYLFS